MPSDEEFERGYRIGYNLPGSTDVQAAFEEQILLLLDERDALLQAKEDAMWRLALAIQWANQFWIGSTQFTGMVEEAFINLAFPAKVIDAGKLPIR